MTPGGDRICIALDFGSRAEVLAMARRLAGRVGWMKVGLEAFVAEGPSLVADVAASAGGARVFLDLKFHDIPATVAGAVTSAARSGAAMVNVHAAGGRAMLAAAREQADAILAQALQDANTLAGTARRAVEELAAQTKALEERPAPLTPQPPRP